MIHLRTTILRPYFFPVCTSQHYPQHQSPPVVDCFYPQFSPTPLQSTVTDVIEATVGIEKEGLEAICPGSRFG